MIEWNEGLELAAKVWAKECSEFFSHTRPINGNGTGYRLSDFENMEAAGKPAAVFVQKFSKLTNTAYY